MDASDVLRRIQSQTQFDYLLANFVATQPAANISTCASAGTVKINYTSFQQRNNLALGKYYANGCSSTTISPIVNSGIPRSPILTQQMSAFFYTNTVQTYTAPAGTSFLNVYLWGSGGRGQNGSTNNSSPGSGGFVSGRINIVSNLNYYIIVGGSANLGLNSGGSSEGGTGARGGGFSGIFSGPSPTQGNAISIAGSGGGGGFNGGGDGGGGGYPSGQSGTGADGGGGGGTQSAGGTSVNTPGSALQGGTGGANDAGGGGGGGGYFGGGARNLAAGGGGGSSYLGSLVDPLYENGVRGGTQGSSVVTPGGTTSPYYVAPYGRGGQPGYVVIVANIYS
jgi:hypothetical protein